MSDCPSLAKCPFFNDKMPDESAMGKLYKKKYCLGDNTLCARWMVAMAIGKEKVPSSLYPNQMEKVEAIITSVG